MTRADGTARETPASVKVLVADDEANTRSGLAGLLSAWGYAVEQAADGQDALERARATLPSVIITDLVMPRLDGLGLLASVREELPFVTVILLTGQGSIDAAVSAMKEGAYDFLTKPVDPARLRLLIPKAVEKAEALREVAVLRRRVKEIWGLGRLVGTSPVMQDVYRLVEMSAPTPAPVLITGESGTGKELVARTIHDMSPRARGPFVAVNCAAIPETLLESEIFGHEKGAFTGALERRPGCFELAHQGTLFLDEIAEMNAATQAKFLRILEDGIIRRLGGRTEITVDVRVVAATNRDPVERMRSGEFREDLFYRLNVVSLLLPPLRDRRDDIALLVQAFIEEFNAKYDKRLRGADNEALTALIAQPWPGNVRELRNTLERAAIVAEGELIELRHLSQLAAAPPPKAAAPSHADDILAVTIGTTLDEAERQLILRTLEANGQNKTQTARVLGISLKTLHNKLHRYAG